ncbi:hypothetical protein TNIN_209741 [Trichonephila inaurata madagascariensis]|uniref:Uncharacterized protein n=1 Tax=Trichonephila inaurata madagascariensis TaxID=2747483 RepID=A0A8X6XDU4_9ARAC|nr:hypothetical protein TNIN_209741 [Trichonephila inaurata madagascariensis]
MLSSPDADTARVVIPGFVSATSKKILLETNIFYFADYLNGVTSACLVASFPFFIPLSAWLNREFCVGAWRQLLPVLAPASLPQMSSAAALTSSRQPIPWILHDTAQLPVSSLGLRCIVPANVVPSSRLSFRLSRRM